jgi:hypothetical protein
VDRHGCYREVRVIPKSRARRYWPARDLRGLKRASPDCDTWSVEQPRTFP